MAKLHPIESEPLLSEDGAALCIVGVAVDPEFQALIPRLSQDEFGKLERDILRDGCLNPLIAWLDPEGGPYREGRVVAPILLDGHHRFEICTKHGIDFDIKLVDGIEDRLSARIWIREHQLDRRNLTDDQRAMQAAALAEEYSERAKRERARRAGETGGRGRPKVESTNSLEDTSSTKLSTQRSPAQSGERKRSRQVASESLGVSERKTKQALKIRRDAPELAAKVESGEIPLAAAVREVKRQEVIDRLEDIGTKEVKAAEGVYDVVVLDPPWPMQKIERDERPNQSEFDYPVMTEAELADMDIPAADDAHVWVWTTHKFLPMALRLLERWGLKYVCTFVWHKPGGFQPIGLPQYNCEFALYARKGSPKFIDTKAFNTCFDAPRGKHSEKPEEFYEVIRRVTAGRRIDMFNRRPIDGFDGWGNEA